MQIAAVEARWLRAPIPEEKQHTSDFGRLRTFDAVLVTVRTKDGAEGFGEAKAAVGSAGDCASLVTIVERELGPALIGQDPRHITRAWERMYGGGKHQFVIALHRSNPFCRLWYVQTNKNWGPVGSYSSPCGVILSEAGSVSRSQFRQTVRIRGADPMGRTPRG